MKKLLILFTALSFSTQFAGAAPQAAEWNFSGWYGGGAYPMITPDPQTQGRVYLISDVGGIWRSDDHGDRFYYRTKGLTNLKTVSLVVAPSDSNILYTGSIAGIHRSVDAGENWSYLPATRDIHLHRPDNYRSLTVDPLDADTIFVGTEDGQVMYSKNAGNSWENLGGVKYPFGFRENTGINHSAISSIVIVLNEKNNERVIFAGSKNGLRRFSFATDRWNQPSSDIDPVYDMTRHGEAIYRTSGRQIAWSASDGAEWKTTNEIPVMGEIYRLSVAADDQGVKITVAWRSGWDGGVFLSLDGGKTWSDTVKRLHPDTGGNPTRVWSRGFNWPLSIAFDPFNSDVIYFSDFWGVWRSDDSGNSWHERIQGAPNTVGSDIVISDQKIYAAGMDAGLAVSRDGGSRFQSLVPGAAYDDSTAGHVWRIEVDGERIVATNSPWNRPMNQVLVSEDAGKNFKKITDGLPARYPLTNTVWEKGYPRALARDPQNPLRYYLGIDGDEGGFFVSSDGGYHWDRPENQPGSLKIYNGLAVDPNKPSRIYWGTVDKGIYRSEDFGSNWTQVFPGAVFDLLVAADGTVYAGMDSAGPALYRSQDHGVSWKFVVRTPDSTGAFTTLAVNPQVQNQIVIGSSKWGGDTSGHIYYSADSGLEWTEITRDLPSEAGSARLKFSEDGKTLYLMQDVGSVYSITVNDAIGTIKTRNKI